MYPPIGGPTLGDLVQALWRHKGKAALVFLLSVAGAVALLAVWPRSYRSEAGLFVRVGRESVTLDPTATTGQNIAVLESRENELNSVLGVLRSRAMAELVVDRLGPEIVLGREPILVAPDAGTGSAATGSADSGSVASGSIASGSVASGSAEAGPVGWSAAAARLARTIGQGLDWLKLREPTSDREQAIRSVSESLAIDTVRKSSVVLIAARADSPALAQAVAQSVLDVYEDMHLRLYRTPGSEDFFLEQHDQTQQALAAAEASLRDAKNRGELVSLSGQQKVLETEVSLIESSLVTARANQAAAQGRVASLRSAIAAVEPTVLAQQVGGINNEAADRIQEKLYELRLIEQDLLAKYTGDHPLLQAIRKQVDGAQEILAQQPKSRIESTTAMNPNRQKLELDLRADEAELAAMEKQIGVLGDQHERTLARLQELNGQEVQIGRLEREVAVLADRLVKYAVNREQARIDGALEAQRISNVNVFQPASYSDRPVSPKKPLVLGGGVLAGLLAAVATAVVWERRYGRVHGPQDLSLGDDAPVLVSVPRGHRHRVGTS